MKKLFFIFMMFFIGSVCSLASDAIRPPENITLTLALIADAKEPSPYVFVINGVVAYQSVDGLKEYLKGLPKGSMVTWAPGCIRMGGEPLLDSPQELKEFREFCESIGITFNLVPSG